MLIAKSKLLTVAPYFMVEGISMTGYKIAEYLSWKNEWIDTTALKGQCVSMEVMQFRWFHWQWNHNETKGLRGFTVHTVDSSQTSHALNLEDHKSIQKDGVVKTNISVF